MSPAERSRVQRSPAKRSRTARVEPVGAVVQRLLRAGPLLQPPALPRERAGSAARGARAQSPRGTRDLLATGTVPWVWVAVVSVWKSSSSAFCQGMAPGRGVVSVEGSTLRKRAWSRRPPQVPSKLIHLLCEETFIYLETQTLPGGLSELQGDEQIGLHMHPNLCKLDNFSFHTGFSLATTASINTLPACPLSSSCLTRCLVPLHAACPALAQQLEKQDRLWKEGMRGLQSLPPTAWGQWVHYLHFAGAAQGEVD